MSGNTSNLKVSKQQKKKKKKKSAKGKDNLIVVQSQSHTQLFVMPWTTVGQASLSFTISQSFLKLMSIESTNQSISHWLIPSNHLILCCSLLLSLVFPSIRVFYNESALLIRWQKHWSFSISSFNKYSGLISFNID